jgi:hypothetical protein
VICFACTANVDHNLGGRMWIYVWRVCSGQRASSIRITEKVSDNKLIITEKYALPDGSITEDKGEMTRVN